MKVKRLLLLVMAICLASVVKAQIYNSDVLFYVSESAKLTNPQTNVLIIRFKDGKPWWVNKGEHRLKNVCDNIKSNSYYYEYKSEIWGEYNTYEYDSDMSNAKWHVYSHYYSYVDGFTALNGSYSPPIEAHTSYEAFKRDFSEYMEWSEPHYHVAADEERGERVTYKRISKDELKKMSFTGARDFLQ